MIFKMTISMCFLFFVLKVRFPFVKRKIAAEVSCKSLQSPSGSSRDLQKESVGNDDLYGKEFFLDFLIIHFFTNVSKEHNESMRIILFKML